jgi:hypothetical protein
MTQFSFTDNFNRANNDGLGANWVQLDSTGTLIPDSIFYTFNVNSNAAYCPLWLPHPNGVFARIATALDEADQVVEAAINRSQAGEAGSTGLMLRMDALCQNGYLIYWYGDAAWFADTVLKVAKRVNGVTTELAEETFSYSNDQTLRVRIEGNEIIVWVNGVIVSRVTDSSISTGAYVGIYSAATAGGISSFENFDCDAVQHPPARADLFTGDGELGADWIQFYADASLATGGRLARISDALHSNGITVEVFCRYVEARDSSDHRITAKLTGVYGGAGGKMGLFARSDATGQTCYLLRSELTAANLQTITLCVRLAGVTTVLATATGVTYTAGLRMELVVFGNRLVAVYDGVMRLEVINAQIDSGLYSGLWVDQAGDDRVFDHAQLETFHWPTPVIEISEAFTVSDRPCLTYPWRQLDHNGDLVPDGSGWTIASALAASAATDDMVFAMRDNLRERNQRVSAKFQGAYDAGQAGRMTGLFCRSTRDARTCYFAALELTAANTAKITLYSRVRGINSELTNVTGIAYSALARLELEANEAILTVRYAGMAVIVMTDTTILDGGSSGFFSRLASEATRYVDDYLAETMTTGAYPQQFLCANQVSPDSWFAEYNDSGVAVVAGNGFGILTNALDSNAKSATVFAISTQQIGTTKQSITVNYTAPVHATEYGGLCLRMAANGTTGLVLRILRTATTAQKVVLYRKTAAATYVLVQDSGTLSTYADDEEIVFASDGTTVTVDIAGTRVLTASSVTVPGSTAYAGVMFAQTSGNRRFESLEIARTLAHEQIGDTFNRADLNNLGTAYTESDPDGAAVPTGSGFAISSNHALIPTANAARVFAMHETSMESAQMHVSLAPTLDISGGVAQGLGVAFMARGNLETGYAALLLLEPPATARIEIYRKHGPALDRLANVAVTYSAAASLVVATGATAVITYNGTEVYEIEDLASEGTFAALLASADGGGVSFLDTLLLYGNQQPTTPTIERVGQDGNVPVRLVASAFDDSDTWSTHAASQWQVTLYSDTLFASPVYDSGEVVTALEEVITTLQAYRNYRARVRYKDDGGLWSEWSASFQFFVLPGTVVTTELLAWPSTLPNPRYPIHRERVYVTEVSKQGKGWTDEKRQSQRSRPLYRFVLNYRRLSQTDIETLCDFHDATLGATVPFVWTHPTTMQSHIVRFESDTLGLDLKIHVVEDVEIQLIEDPALQS